MQYKLMPKEVKKICNCTKESRMIDCPQHGELRIIDKHMDRTN